MSAFVLASLVVACSNSDGAKSGSTAADTAATQATEASASTMATETTGASGSATTDAASARDTFVPINGVPGVSDGEIGFAVIGTGANNPLGTCILACYLDGIKAYFDFRNAEGGIYGRKLVVKQELDDELMNNQAKALEVVSDNQSFGVFNATLVASGWGDLDKAGIPNWVWGIQPADSANRSTNFPSAVALTSRCVDCVTHAVPYAVKTAGAKHVAFLAINATENSKKCAEAGKASIEKYSADIGGADVAYYNDSLAFGLPNGVGPEVTAMKDAGVDFVATCLDLNSDKTIALEMQRQGMGDVPMYHPNGYNQQFVDETGGLFEGDFVGVSILPTEASTAGTTLGDFVTWMGKDGKGLSELALTGWTNASMAFDGLLAAGPEFDRAKVVDATNAMTAATAGGLVAPIDWAKAHTPFTEATRPADAPADCMVLLKVENGKFVTVAPASTPWLCWSGPDWAEPQFTSFSST